MKRKVNILIKKTLNLKRMKARCHVREAFRCFPLNSGKDSIFFSVASKTNY